MNRKNGVEYVPNNLIVNYLPQSMKQEEVRVLFDRVGDVRNCKLVKDHHSGISLGYGFIEFSTSAEAQRAIAEFDGTSVQGKIIKVSHARPSSSDIKNANLYITGLPPTVDEQRLSELFSPFGVIITQKILHNTTGECQGIGFVRYNRRSECDEAISTMNGTVVDNSPVPLTVKYALQPAAKHTHSQSVGSHNEPISALNPMRGQLRYNPMTPRAPSGIGGAAAATLSPQMAANKPQVPWCVYVANLHTTASDLDLYKIFSPLGAIISVKVICDMMKPDHPCKGYGFVNFRKYEDAYSAVVTINNTAYEGKVLQVSFKASKGQNVMQPPAAPHSAMEAQIGGPPLGYDALLGLEKQYLPF